MPSPEAQAAALGALLAAATGCEPRTASTPAGALRIEADLPCAVTAVTRRGILLALSMADRYGHVHTDGGDVVWAELDREAE